MMTPASRRAFLTLTSAAALAAGGCSILGNDEKGSSSSAQGTATGQTSQVTASSDPAGTVVVYFSMPETDKTTGLTTEEENSVIVVDGVALGNTQYAAQLIAQGTGAQIARIEAVDAYPLNHDELIALARTQQDNKERPAIKPLPDMSGYSTVFLGYPIWWSDIPMPLYTFLEGTDLSGRTIIPFCTHGGSRLAGTPEAIAGAAPSATVGSNALVISRDDMESAPDTVSSWLKDLGL